MEQCAHTVSNEIFTPVGRNLQDGFLLLYKRLEKGSFVWPRNESEVQELTGQQFRWLMEGLTISPKRKVQEISIPKYTT